MAGKNKDGVSYSTAWNRANPEKARECRRRWREKNHARQLEATRAWKKDHPGYQRAWIEAHPERARLIRRGMSAVSYAIKRGLLTRPAACEWCGATDCRIDAAHFNYSELLRVVWLCPFCHAKWDRAEPKTAA